MPTNKLPKKLSDLLSEFSEIEDQELKMELLIEFGEKFKPVPQKIATQPYPEDNRVKGCESEAFIFPELNQNGTINFHFAVENPQGISAKAMAYILQDTLSGQDLCEVINISEEVAYQLFGRSLSMGKGLGLTGMIKMLKELTLKQLEAQKKS